MMCKQRNWEKKFWHILLCVTLVMALGIVSVRIWYLASKPDWYEKEMYFTHDFYTMTMTQSGEATIRDYLQAYNADAVVWNGNYFLNRRRNVQFPSLGREPFRVGAGESDRSCL